MPFKDKDKETEYRRLQKRRQRAMSHPVSPDVSPKVATMSHPDVKMSHPVSPDVSPDVSPKVATMSHPDVKMSHPVSPVTKCSLPNCIICHPEKYQLWFKKTFGRYDTYQGKLV